MIAKCLECSGAIEADTEEELENSVSHHMLWEHPNNNDVDGTLAALDVAGGHIVDLFSEGRSVEALMALYELTDIAGRMIHWVEANMAP